MSVFQQINNLSDAWVYSSERANGSDLNFSVGMYKASERTAILALGHEEVASIFETTFCSFLGRRSDAICQTASKAC